MNWPAKVRLVDERLIEGPKPVPDKVTDCGLPGALSAMIIVPVRSPGAAGVKVTLIPQFAPAGTAVPQLLVCEKSRDRCPRRRKLRRSEEHTSELQSRSDLVCRLLLEKKKSKQ